MCLSRTCNTSNRLTVSDYRSPRTGRQLGRHRILLVLGDAQIVRVFHRDLPFHVVAAEAGVGRQPLVGRRSGLVPIGRSIDCQQVLGIVSKLLTALLVPLPGTRAPGIRQGDDVVDLDQRRGLVPPLKLDCLSRVGFGERAREDDAVVRAWLEGGPRQVAGQDVIACVAAIVVNVRPCLSEGLAVVSRYTGGIV